MIIDLFEIGSQKYYSKLVEQADCAAFNSGLVHPVYATFALGRDAEWACRLFVLEMKEEEEEGIEAEFYEVITDRKKAAQILFELAKSIKKEALILLPNDKSNFYDVLYDSLVTQDITIKLYNKSGAFRFFSIIIQSFNDNFLLLGNPIKKEFFGYDYINESENLLSDMFKNIWLIFHLTKMLIR